MKTVIITVIFILALTLVLSCPHAWGFEKSTKLSLDLEAVSLPTILKLIAVQNNLNIVVSGDVKGEISLKLDNVDLATALEAILIPNGYNCYIKNNVYIIKPIESDTPGELESRIITLKYIEPITAVKALETRLSSKGKIVILDKTNDNDISSGTSKANRIMLTDLPVVIDKLISIVQELDKAERLVSIEVKIIETNIDNKSKLGFNWPTDITTDLGAGTQTISENSESGTESESYEATLENVTGSYNLESGRWTWGTLTVNQLTAVLNLLNQQGNSKLISDPHITTLENHQAEIKVQTIIPVATINRFTEGAVVQDIVTFQDEEVG
ncbi:MAG: hypothetical protein U9R56_01585, partial [candidate division Zixibacteria bacterium]|nr:hypothetical protein [candidate division Zixibacteria bacterium]